MECRASRPQAKASVGELELDAAVMLNRSCFFGMEVMEDDVFSCGMHSWK